MQHFLDKHFKIYETQELKGMEFSISNKHGRNIVAIMEIGSLYNDPSDESFDVNYICHCWRFPIFDVTDGTRTQINTLYTVGDTNPFFKHTKSRAPMTNVELRLEATKRKYRTGNYVFDGYEITEALFKALYAERVRVYNSVYKNIKTKEVKPFEKPCPSLIPIGSKIHSLEMFRSGHPSVLTVKSYHKNGVDSYVAEFEEIADRAPMSCFNERKGITFNLSYVDKIISRGKTIGWKDDRCDEFKYSPDNIGKNKFILSRYGDGYVHILLSKFKDAGSIQMDTLINKALSSGICSFMTVKYAFHEGHLTVIKKKAMKRWLKQNINRLKTPKATLLKEEKALDDLMYGDMY